MIFSMVYLSTATRPWSRDDLSTLLSRCRATNTRLGVTGLLVYRDGAFMQVLEGEEEVVRTLYRRISTDERHRDVTSVSVVDAPQRRFPDWSMGFRDLDEHPLDVPGFRTLLERPLDVGSLARRDRVAQVLALVGPSGGSDGQGQAPIHPG